MSLMEVISLTWAYFNRGTVLQDAVLKMYAEDLSDLDPAACIQAYGNWRRNPANKTFPLPAQIRELVAPGEFVNVETLARETAARIVGAITKYGWANAKEAQAYIGHEGWELVKRQGGWQHMRESTTPKQAQFLQSTLRDQLEGVFRYGHRAIESRLGASSQARVSELSQGKDLLRLIPGATDDKGPKGAA